MRGLPDGPLDNLAHSLSAALKPGGAVLVMAVVSAGNTAIPLLLGHLVNQVEAVTQQNADRDAIIRTAAWFLGLVAGIYVLREVLNVVRRYFVENTCTRINRDMSV